MREILRVLKSGGTLIISAETYRGGAYAKLQRPVMKLLRSFCLGVEEHRELFSKAGYTDVQTFEKASRGRFCGVGGSLRVRHPDGAFSGGSRSDFGNWLSTFVGLRPLSVETILSRDRLRLEDVASGYWTPPVKWSSGLVSHYGSTPSSSARPLDTCRLCYNCFDRWRTILAVPSPV